MKKKTARKVTRRVTKIAKVASAAAKTKMVLAKPAGYVSRTALHSAIAKYRMAMAKLNSERHQAKMLSCKICDLQCKIEELEQKLAAAQTTPTT